METNHYLSAARDTRLAEQAEAEGVAFLTLYYAEQARTRARANALAKRPLRSINFLK